MTTIVTVPIPAWTPEGLLPAADASNPTSADRAPYPVGLTDVMLRFSTSQERIDILHGLLDYRARLHSLGLSDGFQWLDGSFVENIELSARARPPGDIDVITFYKIPQGVTQLDLFTRANGLFPASAADVKAVKDQYHVDGRLVHLGLDSSRLVDRSAYWYGVWSHQRDSFKWKGFLQVELASTHDSAARAILGPATSATSP